MPKRRRKASVQLSLAARGAGRGGYRARAGRKRKPERERTFVAHRRRPELPKRTPVHVAMRVVAGIPSLRRQRTVKYIRRCIQLAHKRAFRVVHFSVQTNHVHIIVEADDARALSRGMQGLKIRLARRLNPLFGRRGPMFADRYHARPITSPRQARHCLQYVLNNARKHAAERGRVLARDWVDPFSSAPTFDGWAGATITGEGATRPGITQDPAFFLLRVAWRRYGPLDPNAVPGPAPRPPRLSRATAKISCRRSS